MRNRALIYLVALLLIPSILAGVASASDISNAKWAGSITVTNASTSASGVSVNISGLNSTNMINQHWLNSSANNSAIQSPAGADIPFMPGYGANAWWVWVASVSDYVSDIYPIYSQSATGGKIRYFPGSAGMSTANSTSLATTNNWSLETSAYFDTSASAVGSNVTYKQNSIKTWVSSAGVISSAMVPTNYALSYDGGDYASKAAAVVSPSGGNISVEAIIYPTSLPGSSMAIVNCGSTASWTDYLLVVTAANKIAFQITNSAGTDYATNFLSTNTISANTTYYIQVGYSKDDATKTNLYVNGASWAGSDTGIGGAISQPNTYLVTGASWSGAAYANNFRGKIDEVRISGTKRTAAEATANYISATEGRQLAADANTTSVWHFNEDTGTSVTDTKGNNTLTLGAAAAAPTWASSTVSLYASLVSASMSSGEKVLTVSANTTHYKIAIDGAEQASIALDGTITNTSAVWSDCEGAVTPYVSYVKKYVSGVLQQYIYWGYEAIFTDHSPGGLNPATPTFRTTSSDADVTASLTSFTPVTEPTAPAYAVGSGPDFYTTNITLSGNFTSGNSTLVYPGQRVIHALATATSTPEQLPTTIIWSFLILVVSIVTSAFLKSAFLKMCVIGGSMGFAIAVHVFDWWMLIFFLMLAVAALYASNERVRSS